MDPNIMNSEIIYDWGKFCVEGEDFADFWICQMEKMQWSKKKQKL